MDNFTPMDRIMNKDAGCSEGVKSRIAMAQGVFFFFFFVVEKSLDE